MIAAPRSPESIASALVAQLFYSPLLAEVRRLPFGRGVGHGGRGEEIFGEQLDQHFADAVAARTAGGLKRAVVRRMERDGMGPRGASLDVQA